jgi:excisionase family DNA binding protein
LRTRANSGLVFCDVTWRPRNPRGICRHPASGVSLRLAVTVASKRDGQLPMATKTVFTTGEAAKICKVSQQTIIRCFDSGQLKGFRVPGSRFRRIPREQLFIFMRDNGIPTDALESGKRKILIVDDDEELVELISDVLERDGRFEVRSVNNGFDAGMMVKEYRPDLIVLDVMLPDINGKEVCQRVRSDKTMDDVRIICISGMVEEDKVGELKAAGADDFMHKPFEVEKLVDRMCQLLDIEAVTST